MSSVLPAMLDFQQFNVNSTLVSMITPQTPSYPFYYVPRDSVFSFAPDKVVGMAMPLLAYWVLSLTFYAIDCLQLPYFESKRIHESEEVISRNKVTVPQVIKMVLWQQAVQTALGLWWLDGAHVATDHLKSMSDLAPKVATGLYILLGPRTGETVLRTHGESIVRWMYWWGIPLLQMWFGL